MITLIDWVSPWVRLRATARMKNPLTKPTLEEVRHGRLFQEQGRRGHERRRGRLGAIKENNLKKEAERLNAPYPGRVHPPLTDVTKLEQVQSLAGAARFLEDRLDFVFNNAGVGMTLTTEKVAFDLWKRIVDLDLFCDASKGR